MDAVFHLAFPMSRLASLLALCCLALLNGCVLLPPEVSYHRASAEIVPPVAKAGIPADQLLVVVTDAPHTSLGRLYALERGADGGWRPFAGPIAAMVGRSGFAAPGAKREGDGGTPTGLFPLEQVFGYAPSVATGMPYRQATADDIWVDDVNSADYNRWVRKGETAAASFEELRLPDNLYRHGIVIGYNRAPVIRGAGSAIFVHVWREEGKTTAGCVAVAEHELVRIIGWLDPRKRPAVLMGTRGELAGIADMAALIPADCPVPESTIERQIREKLAGCGGRTVEYRSAEGFFGVAVAVPPTVEAQMREKRSWREGCPVPIADLSYLVLSHWGFDGLPKAGELVVHKKLALPVIKAFAELFALRFPIERMELIERFDADDDKSMAANNTSAFNCRDVTGRPGVLSKHSYGGAIDINPLQNPYVLVKGDALKRHGWDGGGEKVEFLKKLGFTGASPTTDFCRRNPGGCAVLPPESAPFLDRTAEKAGMLIPGYRAVESFTDKGFVWGGAWANTPDYQHFEDGAERLAK